MTVGRKLGRREFGALAAAGGLAMLAGPLPGQHVYKEVHALKPGEFTWHPERQPDGPVSVIVSLDEQKVHVYRNGVRIAVSTCSSGKPGHETPTGVFVVLQKDADHRSSTYNNAPMPNMNRLTWGGIALHAGNLPGYPASHGCVRLPLAFSKRLFEITHLGTPVIIAAKGSAPDNVVHPGFILSEYSETEFENVLATLEPRKHPSDWALEDAYPITSVIASSHDERIVIIENDREVADGPLIWDGKPLGPHVYILHGPDSEERGMKWEALTYDGDRAGAEHDLTRVRTDPDFAAVISEHSHPGMIFIFTDLPLHPDRRSGRDFVIMS
ncbi:L,D-transpeptidase [Chachezhania antarctica]|uniref:L,D-transpeptidase n=1 Tax=Chachezhania antarctica TaxID=2340860 RepID=UPI000EABFC72|nr:L,D-transpeptidase [Chachezhania antarctica]|tara:strand:+ start:1090 stop:2070 length:981 start_codon:yes stop_codon:yes gene_type:complete